MLSYLGFEVPVPSTQDWREDEGREGGRGRNVGKERGMKEGGGEMEGRREG